jgi:hypothetical protein
MTSVPEHHKRQVESFVDEVWNQGHLDLIEELVANDHMGYVSCLPEPVVGSEGVRRLASSQRRADGHLYIKIDHQIAEEDLVASRWRTWATSPKPTGSTGHERSWNGISLVRLLAGRQGSTPTP